MRIRFIASVFVLAMVAGAASGAPRGAGEGVRDCGDGHSITWSPTSIWPPNHQYKTVTITYSDTNPEHDLVLAVTRVSHNEVAEDGTELNGAGNTPVASDGVITNPGGTGRGSVKATVDVRAERSGKGTGRTYTIDYTAKSMDGDTEDDDCSGSVTVAVPHDCRGGACKAFKPEQGSTGSGKGKR